MKPTESKEMYLKVIFDIYLRGQEIRSVDIAKILGYSKPSVSRGMNILRDEGYINMEPYGNITLTEKGKETAKNVKMRHIYLTKYLIKSLGIDETTAMKDACHIEHVISREAMEAIENYVKED